MTGRALAVAWVAVALSGCSGAEPEEDVPERVLDDRAFRFCHVSGANAAQVQRWCAMLDDLPDDVCPGMRETCAGASVPDPVGCEGAGGEPNGVAGAPNRPADDDDPFDLSDLKGLDTLLRWIAAIGVAALVAVVLRLIWISFGVRTPLAAKADEGADVVPVDPDAPEDLPDAPSADLLADARAALSSGRTSDAVLLARAAALRGLGDAGRLRLHRARTDREYVRALGSGDGAPELREIVRATEAVRWQGTEIGSPRADAAVKAAERLLSGTGTLAVWALALAAALAWSEPAHAQSLYRFMPDGDAALKDVLTDWGYDAGYRLRNLADVDDTVDVVVIDLSAIEPYPEHWPVLRDWVAAGGVLVLAGDASGPFPELGGVANGSGAVVAPAFAAAGLPAPRWPDPIVSGYLLGAAPPPDAGPPALAEDEADDALAEDGMAEPPSEAPSPLASDARALVSAVPSPEAPDAPEVALIAVLDLGAGVVVAICDPSILWNAAFADPDNERFVGELVYLGQSLEGWPVGEPAVVQLATWASASAPSGGGAANNPLAALASAGLLAFVAQLLATWTIAAMWRGWPFAPLRDPVGGGRTAFVEHLTALGTRYLRLGAHRHAARALAALWLARLRPEGLQWAAQRNGYTTERARAWAKEIEALAVLPDAPAERTSRAERAREAAELAAKMEELWRLTSGTR